MRSFQGEATLRIASPAATVFDVITDVDGLPEWNDAIEKVLVPAPELVPGASWTVQVHPPHVPPWGSVSTVTAIDPEAHLFQYRTRHINGNPSWADWTWRITPATEGESDVSVSWDVVLNTADRRLLAGPLRKRQLLREVPKSLEALAARAAQVSSS